MITRYLSFRKLGLPLVLAAVLLLLLAGPVFSAQVELLNDGFENTIAPFDNWDDNETANWSISNSLYHSGTRSARGNHGANYLSSDDLDASDAVSIEVDFWFRKTDLTNNDFTLYYCYGASTCTLVAELDSLGADDTWLHYTETITDSQYLTSTFYIRFEGPPPPSERVFVDDVLVTKETGGPQTLTVSKTGTGSGTVTSSPAGINCGDDCSEVYDYGSVVTLSAAAAAGSTFTGWSGACTGTGDCVISMDAARSVTATFTLEEYTLTVNVISNGSVQKVPDQATYHYGDVVQLTAMPGIRWEFVNWSGDLTGTTNPDSITMDGDKTVTATFEEEGLFIYLPILLLDQ